ncbi:MAG TPA: FAD-dependent oxidoreductase, partial [Myxococcales bacterium]
MIWDVAICGGGPAGLAAAVHAARAGFSTLVLERTPGVPDKACGEGLMPR